MTETVVIYQLTSLHSTVKWSDFKIGFHSLRGWVRGCPSGATKKTNSREGICHSSFTQARQKLSTSNDRLKVVNN